MTMFEDGEGFEPPEVLPSAVFKTAALNHSANHPYLRKLVDSNHWGFYPLYLSRVVP